MEHYNPDNPKLWRQGVMEEYERDERKRAAVERRKERQERYQRRVIAKICIGAREARKQPYIEPQTSYHSVEDGRGVLIDMGGAV